MKARLVESHRERIAEDRARRDQGRRPELLHRDRGLAAHRRRGRRHPDAGPGGRARADRGARGLEGRARPGRGRAALDELAEAARDASANIMPATIEAAKAGATTGEWAGVLREVFGDYRAPTGVGRRRGPAGERRPSRRGPRARRGGLRAARPPDPHPGRQARPRRPLERRRADRRPRARRRHGGDLPGDPPDARADRRLRASTRTSTWSASRSSPARTASWFRASSRCCGGRPRRAGRGRRDHPRRRRRRAARGRRGARLHARRTST